MHRAFGLAALLAFAVLATFVVGPGQFRTGAQGGTPTAAGQSFVGSWRLTVSSPGSPSTQSLTTITADGTLLDSDQPVSPGGGGFPTTVSSTGHGVWQQIGTGTAAISFVELVTDTQGTFLATVTINAQVTLSADGNAFGGPYTVTGVDPKGKVLFQGTGTVQATRITIQPMGTPTAGTPAA